jgi:Ser/Thr protein kinase RdoA (MazF antagonist)
MISAVLKEYGFNSNECSVQSFGTGLINSTWKITRRNDEYILQCVNQNIFKHPEYIAENIRTITAWLREHHPEYLFVAPVQTITGNDMVNVEGNHFRMFPFVKGSHTIDVVIDPASAYEAAKQFGAFTKKTSGLDATALKITLPDFHNLTLRYGQFENALNNGDPARIETATTVIEQLKNYKDIVDAFEIIKKDPGFKIRVTHHDTKISNVLFDEKGKGLCVIDPDTIMPGYFISDVGDMLRTYLSPANEEETDLDKIEVRQEYLDAIIKGYLSEMEDELTEKEKAVFIYAGIFMIYMQALRFFTDYLNNDIYYGERYEGHNLVRAKNQLVLLGKLIA